MNVKIYILLLVFAISACKEENKVTDSEQKDTTSVEQVKSDSSVAMKQQNISNVLLKSEVKHLFSDTENPDLFQLYLNGDSLLSGTVQFNIISFKGDTLHTEKFPANYLIGYALDWESSSLQEKETFIKQRVKNFFSEDQFLKPAIKPNEKFDDDYADRQNWEEIKGDRMAIGYQYLVGEEDTKRIAWSKKRKKIVIYYNCC